MKRKSLVAGLRPTHPGAFLAEIVLPATGKSRTEIAALLGISRQTLYDVLHERQPITVNLALRLGKLFGNGAAFWLDMQQAFDIAKVEASIDLDSIPTIGEAA